MTENLTRTTNLLPDPGQPPYCSACGHTKIAAPSQQSRYGVCLTCGAVVQPEISVGGELRPFLNRVSELAPLPPEIMKLRGKVLQPRR
jgi:hypothetical protein